MHTYILIYLILVVNLTSAKGPHRTESTLNVPQDLFSQCKLLAQYPQRNFISQRVYFKQVRYIHTTAT